MMSPLCSPLEACGVAAPRRSGGGGRCCEAARHHSASPNTVGVDLAGCGALLCGCAAVRRHPFCGPIWGGGTGVNGAIELPPRPGSVPLLHLGCCEGPLIGLSQALHISVHLCRCIPREGVDMPSRAHHNTPLAHCAQSLVMW